MKNRTRIAALALVTLLGVAMTADAARIYVRIGPPPVVVERQIVAPQPGLVWQPGYYQYSGTRYVWARGTWATPPYRHARWVEGHWRRTDRGYYWVPGHWRRF